MDLKQRKYISPLSIPNDGAGGINTQGSGEFERRSPKRSKSGIGTTIFGMSPVTFVIVVLVTMLVGTGTSWYFFSQIFLKPKEAAAHRVQQQIIKQEEAQHDVEWQAKLSAVTLAKTELEQQVTQLQQQQLTNKQKLQTAIQAFSKTRLLKKYGPPPYYVKVRLAIDPKSNIAPAAAATDKPKEESMIWELASPDLMPHTVYWFLEQVDGKMYDGWSFHLTAGHVVQAGAVLNFLSPPDATLMLPFRESALETLLFPEYSDQFPHVKYTVGFAGRPGGPAFFINMVNNTKAHGPGVQGEADPCFAKIVHGMDVADRIQKSATKPGKMLMEHNVAIRSIRLTQYDTGNKTAEVVQQPGNTRQ